MSCRQRVTICNTLGLHARAAAKLVKQASAFSSEVFLEKDGQQVNGKSIMGVMMLAAAKGCELTIITQGQDEHTALSALVELVNTGFGEDT